MTDRIELGDGSFVFSLPFGSKLTREVLHLDEDACPICEMYPMTSAENPVALLGNASDHQIGLTFCSTYHAEKWINKHRRELDRLGVRVRILQLGDVIPWPKHVTN